ncbi:MAG TPA: cholesterol oxidase substrate-binding domain-containing protein [Nevskiaceae bacterium]|nr:cholesterol oxidase substrate-binding domain-containing protein [Nevskiaceae bacterium]
MASGVAPLWAPFAQAADSVALHPDRYENWAGDFRFDNVLTCAPTSPSDVADLANWCVRQGYALRPRGAMHNWSPLCAGDRPIPMVMADTLPHLDRMEITTSHGLPAVRVQTGARMEDLLAFIESQGFGFTAVPAVGEISVGGALAIDGHGAAVPAVGEPRLAGQTYGSMSNRVLAATAVVWSERRRRYVLRTFDRTDAEMEGLLVHLGRAFLTEVTLALEPLSNLRCVSYVDIPASELFGAPGNGGRTIASFLDSAGRLEAIWYPLTDRPWLKVWSVESTRPRTSRTVRQPYNYPFSDNLPDAVSNLARQLVTGNAAATPLFGQLMYAVSAAGLAATAGIDLWGAAKNTLLFVKSTTLRIHELSVVVLTRRDQVQRVVHDFTAQHERMLQRYAEENRYPINMPVEIRVTGLDHAADLGVAGARTAALSALSPRPDHPEWDTAVFLSALTLPGTTGMHAFFHEMGRWLWRRFDGTDACVRPEWSKGWAYTDEAAWRDPDLLGRRIPDAFRAGRGGSADWDAAMAQLDALDPRRLFRNAFLKNFAKGAG